MPTQPSIEILIADVVKHSCNHSLKVVKADAVLVVVVESPHVSLVTASKPFDRMLAIDP